MITELAIGVEGGKENTLYLVLSVRADAMLDRRVVIAGMLNQSCYGGRGMGQVIHELEPARCYPCGKG